MARRRSEPSCPTTPVPSTVLNIGIVDSPEPLTIPNSTAVTPSRPRALFDTPPPGSQPAELLRSQRSRSKSGKYSQYQQERDEFNNRSQKIKSTKARKARKTRKAKKSTRRRSNRRIESENSDANTTEQSADEAGGTAASKSPTPVPHSLVPEGQVERLNSEDYEHATREDITKALMELLRENCNNSETQDIRKTLQQLRIDQKTSLDAQDGYTEIEVLSQAPLGAGGGFILNHPANDTQPSQPRSQQSTNTHDTSRHLDDNQADITARTGADEPTFHFDPRYMSPVHPSTTYSSAHTPRPFTLPFLGYPPANSPANPPANPPANAARSFIEIDDDDDEGDDDGIEEVAPYTVDPRTGRVMYGIPTDSQSLGDPISRQSPNVGPRPSSSLRDDNTRPHDYDQSFDRASPPTPSPGPTERGDEPMDGVDDEQEHGEGLDGGLGLGPRGEPMEEDEPPYDDDERMERGLGEADGEFGAEDFGGVTANLPTSAQLSSRGLRSPEPAPEVLQLTQPSTRRANRPPPPMPSASSRRKTRLDNSWPYPSRLNIIERGGKVVRNAAAYLTPTMPRRVERPVGPASVAPAHPLSRPPRPSQASVEKRPALPPPLFVRQLATSAPQPHAPAPRAPAPRTSVPSTSVPPLSAFAVRRTLAHLPLPVFNPPPPADTGPRLPTAPDSELLSSDEEARAAAAARAEGKAPARQSKKPTMAHLYGFEYQVTVLAKLLMLAESFIRGAWQTRGTFRGLLRRGIWARAWGMELGPHIPHEEASWKAEQVILNGLAGGRGKCKERARPIMASRPGFIRYPKTNADFIHNQRIYTLLSGDRFHFSDPANNQGPFQSIMLYESIAEIVFNGPSSVGAIFPDLFRMMPDPLIGFVLCIMEHCRDEWQTGRHIPRDLNAAVMLGRYIHHMERLEVMQSEAPRLMTRLRGEWFQHGFANTQTAPIIERPVDDSLKAFAELCRQDARASTTRTYARRPASAPRPTSTPRPQLPVRVAQPVASSSRPQPLVADNRPPPEPMEFDEDEEDAPPVRPPSPADPFADERHSDGRYTSRAKGKGRR